MSISKEKLEKDVKELAERAVGLTKKIECLQNDLQTARADVDAVNGALQYATMLLASINDAGTNGDNVQPQTKGNS